MRCDRRRVNYCQVFSWSIKKVELYPGVEEAASGASLERKSRSWTWSVMSLSC